MRQMATRLGVIPANEYEQRALFLRKIGFRSYGDYLRSPMWKWIRSTVLRRDGHRCRWCGAQAYTVHHLDYWPKTLSGERLAGMATICHTCHERAEMTTDGQKRTLFEANRYLGKPKRLMCKPRR